MTPAEQENAIRAQCLRCTEEIKKAMSKKPKPQWDATVKPSSKNTTSRLRRLASASWSS